MKIHTSSNNTFGEFILKLQSQGLFKPRRIPINQVTLAKQSDIRPGKTFPIDLSTRTLGEVPLSEVMTKTSVKDLLNLNKISENGIVVELQRYVDESGISWGPKTA